MFLLKTKYTLAIEPSNHAFWHLWQRNKNVFHTKTCAQLFIAVLSVTAKSWKQIKCTKQMMAYPSYEILFGNKKGISY